MNRVHRATSASSATPTKSKSIVLAAVAVLTLLSLHTLTFESSLLSSLSSADTDKWKSKSAVNNNDLSSGHCMSLGSNGDMDLLLAKMSQVFIVMPPKASGSAIKEFTRKCTNRTLRDNLLNYEQSMNSVFDHGWPSIVASHLYSDKPLIRLSKYPTRSTLIIYVHREEHLRVISGIKQMASNVCTGMVWGFKDQYGGRGKTFEKFKIVTNDTHCILDKGAVLDGIKNRKQENGIGIAEVLTCGTYEAIQDNAPQLLFVNYKQIDKLQVLLAKHHCPELIESLPIHSNVQENKLTKILLRSIVPNNDADSNNETTIPLDDWLNEKSSTLEWSLNLRDKVTCQAKTVWIETQLFACPDEVFKVTPERITG